MRSLEIKAVGEPSEVITLASREAAKPGEGQVSVRMEAAPINPSDFMLVRGRYAVKPVFPFALGAEGVGRVCALGEGVDSDWNGARVIVLPTNEVGTWAEQLVVPVRNLVMIGESGDSLQMSMLGINPLTAWLILNKYKRLKPGDTIAQTAANSAVGNYVSQLARQAGVNVVNIVRRHDAVDEVLNHPGDFTVVDDDDLVPKLRKLLIDRKLSLVLDSVGGRTAGSLTSLMEHGGAIVCYAAQSGSAPLVSPVDLNFKGLSIHGFWLINWLRTTPRQEIEAAYRGLAELTKSQKINARVEAVYRIEEHKPAIAHALNPHGLGKIIFQF